MASKGPNSRARYQAKRPQIELINKARRAAKHKRRMSKQIKKTMRTPMGIRIPRGHTRALARRNIVQWKKARDARSLNTGTVRVTAPSLDMLGHLIGGRSA